MQSLQSNGTRAHVVAGAEKSRSRLFAIGLMCLALACFAGLDTTAKYLGHHVPPLEVSWFRYVFHTLVAFAALNPWTAPGTWVSRNWKLQIARSLMLATTTVLNFIALHYLRLDQTVTIYFLTPLMVALLAGPLLGEWVGPRRMAAIMVGFVGVLIATRPGFGSLHPAVLYSLAGAFIYSLYGLATRSIAAYDSSQTSFAISGLVGAVVIAPAIPFVWVTPPSLMDWLLLAMTGVLGGVGHLLLIVAHRHAPAPILAPFIYTQLVWMIILGFSVFGDVPDGWTLAGASVVIAAGLYLLARERTRKADMPAVADDSATAGR